jgi:hypothetical protein
MYKNMSKRYFKYKEGDPWCDLFVEAFAQDNFLIEYQKYINGYDQANQLILAARKAYNSRSLYSSSSLELLGEFIEKQLASNTYGFSSLSSFLISPIQRLPRYLLFFKDLQKCTSTEHPDYDFVVQSSESLHTYVF